MFYCTSHIIGGCVSVVDCLSVMVFWLVPTYGVILNYYRMKTARSTEVLTLYARKDNPVGTQCCLATDCQGSLRTCQDSNVLSPVTQLYHSDFSCAFAGTFKTFAFYREYHWPLYLLSCKRRTRRKTLLRPTNISVP